MPLNMGLGGSQPYSQGNSRKSSERFQGLSSISPKFLPGKSQLYWGHGLWFESLLKGSSS